MKYFIDTEFIEGFYTQDNGKQRHFIDLISIGIVAEDGRCFYAISNEFNSDDANEWVKENVLSKLPERGTTINPNNRKPYEVWMSNEDIAKCIINFINPQIQGLIDTYTRHDAWAEIYYPNEFEYIKKHKTKIPEYYWKSGSGGYVKNRELIYNQPEFYAYYADYDWVVFCSLFGRMIDLPKGFPMYCIDLKQIFDEKQTPYLDSPDPEWADMKTQKSYPKQKNEHNALDDAKWNYELYKFLMTNKK